MRAVAVVQLIQAVRLVLVVLVAAVLVDLEVARQLLEQQILAVVAAVRQALLLAAQAAPALLSFDTQTHLPLRHLQQVHQPLQLQAATEFTNGQVQGVSHSDGTLCTTQ
jgi:hypothetical protein